MENFEINCLKDYFDRVRVRPGMYLGENTISKLYDHLQGYKMAFSFYGVRNSGDQNFFNNFNDFVCDYYELENKYDWKSVILEQNFGNENLALHTFFELFDLFNEHAAFLNSKKIVLFVFNEFVFNQGVMEQKLGRNFEKILSEFMSLVKDNLFSKIKSEFDYIYEQLKEKPEMELILSEFQNG